MEKLTGSDKGTLLDVAAKLCDDSQHKVASKYEASSLDTASLYEVSSQDEASHLVPTSHIYMAWPTDLTSPAPCVGPRSTCVGSMLWGYLF